MPYGTVLLRRTWFCVLASYVFVLAQDVAAAASGELAIDRQLAEQYGTPEPAPLVDPVGSATAQPATPSAFDAAAGRRLEQEIDAALAEAAAQKSVTPKVRAAATGPWSTAAVVSGALLVIALVCVMLTLAARELRKDAKQRRRSYRRRVRRREPIDTTPISAP